MPERIYDGPHDAVDVLGRVGVPKGVPVEFTAAEVKLLGPEFVTPKKPAKKES